MSRTSKAFFGLSLVIAVASIGGVHLSQYQERQTMFAGVLRDDARLAAKRLARQVELDQQRRKQAYLETLQNLPSSNSTSTGVGVEVGEGVEEGSGVRVMSREEAEGVDWSCKDCERR